MLSGIFLIDKLKDKSSHDIVDIVRRKTGQKKVGHTGTLDPMATGLLVMILGKATRLLPYLNDDKEYEGTIRFGITTDTLDAEGKELTNSKCSVDSMMLQKISSSFTGEIDQVPPMVSAIKINGKPLYKLARAGKEVERKPRRVSIYAFDLIDLDEIPDHPKVDFKVACSKGTYIRALASDIGEKLGCGAHLERLRRTRSGKFSLDKAITVDKFNDLSIGELENELLIPPRDALDFTEVAVDGQGELDIAKGRPIKVGISKNGSKAPGEGSFASIIGPSKDLIAVAESFFKDGEIMMKPKTVLI